MCHVNTTLERKDDLVAKERCNVPLISIYLLLPDILLLDVKLTDVVKNNHSALLISHLNAIAFDQ